MLRFQKKLRKSEKAILDIPVDVYNNRAATQEGGKNKNAVPSIGIAGARLTTGGTSLGINSDQAAPMVRRRLGDLVTPMDKDGMPDPVGSFVQAGASTIDR